MTDDNDAYICELCATGWNSESAAERCCEDDNLTGYSPSKSRVRYDLGYD